MKAQRPKELIVTTRKLVLHGKTLYVSMPKNFVEKHGLKKGERIPVLADHIMKVIPMGEE
jgi:hypothetical protein